jgi:DNA adenine methylase
MTLGRSQSLLVSGSLRYKEMIRRRILSIDQVKNKINFIEGDGFEVCKKNANREDVVYFIDHASKMQAMVSRCKFETRLIAMKNTHHAKKTELIIGKDLTWLQIL